MDVTSFDPGHQPAAGVREGRFSRAYAYARAFGLALVTVALLEFFAVRCLEHPAPMVLIAIAAAVSAWHGGAGPGLLTTALCMLGAWWLTPAEWLTSSNPAEIVRLALTALAGTVVSLLGGALHKALKDGVRLRKRLEEIQRGRSD